MNLINSKYVIYFIELLNRGQERSIKVKKNIFALFIIKGLGIIVSFLMVPITLDYLNITEYGIWLTLSSLITWLNFFDIGLGNGLRNKFTEAVTNGETKLARIYVSTTYAILFIIIVIIFIIFIIVNPFVDWTIVFNAPDSLSKELSVLVLFVFSFFCLQFILNLIGTVLIADQKPAINGIFGLTSSILSLIIIYILTKTTNGSLIILGIVISSTTVVVLLTANIVLFKTKYRVYSPNIKYVRFSYARNLLNLGIKFFLIQIAATVLFSTSNLVITQLFGPEEVAPFNIAYKYFGFSTMGFSIIITPFWSAYTEAFAKKDHNWIIEITKKLKKIWFIISILSLLLLVFSDFFYRIWVGDKLEIPFLVSLSMFIYSIIVNWGSIFVAFINGIGKIKLQLITGIVAAVVNIPLSIVLAKTFHLGVSGIIISNTLCIFYGPLLAPIQYRKILSKSATGIWNK